MDKPHPFRLGRFVEAQDPCYATVLEELRAGRKRSHWMWFIFPQLRGLGRSSTAREFGIASAAEARAYAEHPVLGPRLRECTRLVVDVEGHSAEEIFSYPDVLKFRSCMTLFKETAPEPQLFHTALAKYFGGEPDRLTLELLERDAASGPSASA